MVRVGVKNPLIMVAEKANFEVRVELTQKKKKS